MAFFLGPINDEFRRSESTEDDLGADLFDRPQQPQQPQHPQQPQRPQRPPRTPALGNCHGDPRAERNSPRSMVAWPLPSPRHALREGPLCVIRRHDIQRSVELLLR
jgi:hypothetical protein